MRIAHFEISNFRKLKSVRIDISEETTLFVGANNSGKTSAMLALRLFLISQDRTGLKFHINDFTLSNWHQINEIGEAWEKSSQTASAPTCASIDEWIDILPALDIWLLAEDGEIHLLSKLIPTLDWSGGLIGVRLRFEPNNLEIFFKDFIRARNDVKKLITNQAKSPRLWPEDMKHFLERKLLSYFSLKTYALDPSKFIEPENGNARPQTLIASIEPIEGSSLSDIIHVNEINAQRGFGSGPDETSRSEVSSHRNRTKLSEQLQTYYANHLDPADNPTVADLEALVAIEEAEGTFNNKLDESFEPALEEIRTLNYPGVTDPDLKISTRLRMVDGLNHKSAVQYAIKRISSKANAPPLYLPEDSNGLGYQNLVSMIFRLMSFRDSWMKVGKTTTEAGVNTEMIKPLQLVLVEEPEAHLHAQVQQVFIREAYNILRKHKNLGKNKRLTTQLIVSTHSSHIAHEMHFSNLRYFRRLPAVEMGSVPVSSVVNLSSVFGKNDETDRFVTRYIRSQHCDLFFADAAILLEGTAERMLLPHFLRENFEFLNRCYITLLDIGGSHAHRLEPLIRNLGMLTLVITDIDAYDSQTKSKVQPTRNCNQVTSNPTLKFWSPKLTSIDELLNANPDQKECTYEDDPLLAVKVAYQTTLSLSKSIPPVEALASTFEDALALENQNFFSNLKGGSLANKFRESIKGSESIISLASALFVHLKDGDKAEFALDVIAAEQFDIPKKPTSDSLEINESTAVDTQDFESIVVPTYIREGLQWLDGRLQRKQDERLSVSKKLEESE
jgi:predicted ATP-dependent endonuclease of OLD family